MSIKVLAVNRADNHRILSHFQQRIIQSRYSNTGTHYTEGIIVGVLLFWLNLYFFQIWEHRCTIFQNAKGNICSVHS